jgi:uncharacterized protein YcnI
MRKIGITVFALLLSLTLFAGAAYAHVVVYPQQSTQGAYEKFTVRVPSEKKGIATVKVEVRFNPAEVSVSRFEPMAGWTYQTTADASGAITSVVWTAQGDGLKDTEFAEFNMQGRVADKAAAITWKAYQTYKDGSVVEWVGAADSDTPASVTKVSPKPAGANAAGAHDSGTAATTGGAGGENGAKLPLILSIVAVVLGALALIVALSRRRKA